ncbi:MAG: CoA pyrophosphatase [Myxococcota bacterium]|jgi:8-oxo-dGTP pyrophosphatase MutT (NUDIX family)
MRFDYSKLSQVLEKRKRRVRPLDGLLPSGVTIPLFDRDDITHVMVTLRTQKVKHHKGQISFPGGAVEDDDGSIEATAIRETVEEVGIPPSHMHILGKTDDITTISGFVVTPVVVRLDHPFPTSISEDEIDRLIEIPLAALVAPDTPRTEIWDWYGKPVEMYFYDYGEYTVWGATGRMLYQFLDVAKDCII